MDCTCTAPLSSAEHSKHFNRGDMLGGGGEKRGDMLGGGGGGRGDRWGGGGEKRGDR